MMSYCVYTYMYLCNVGSLQNQPRSVRGQVGHHIIFIYIMIFWNICNSLQQFQVRYMTTQLYMFNWLISDATLASHPKSVIGIYLFRNVVAVRGLIISSIYTPDVKLSVQRLVILAVSDSRLIGLWFTFYNTFRTDGWPSLRLPFGAEIWLEHIMSYNIFWLEHIIYIHELSKMYK